VLIIDRRAMQSATNHEITNKAYFAINYRYVW